MKRLISIGLYLISCVCLVAQTTKTYTLTFDENDFSFILSDKGDYILSETQPLRYDENTSLPELPYLEVNILLPENCTCNGFSYDIKDSVSVGKEITLKANSGAVPTNQPISAATIQNIYPLTYYPFEIGMMNENNMDGYRYVALKVSPFSYNAKEKRLKYASKIDLTIKLQDAYLPHPATSFYGKESIELIIKDMVINPEEFYFPKQRTARTKSSRSGQNDSIKYLIVTSANLKNTFQELANWKTTKGVKAKIETVEDIYSTYTGASNQIKIKKCIYDYKLQGLEYVLLGGDVEIIPAQGCYGEVKLVNNSIRKKYDIPTDLFYSLFNGDFSWNADGDSIIGELEDNVSFDSISLAIARIPVATSQEVSTFINKTINYELNPPATRHNTMLLVGNKTVYYHEDGHSDSETKSIRMYNSRVKAYSPAMNMSYFFDTNTSHEDSAAYELNATNLQTELTKGFHHIHVMTHGLPIAWELENGVYDNADALSLCNTSTPSIIVTTACHTNAFDTSTPCLSESFMKNPQSGVVAYLGSSREGWSTSTSGLGASLLYNGRFYKALFQTRINRFGKLIVHMKDINKPTSYGTNRWLHFSLNAIGDPELPIYIDSPQTIEGVSWVYQGNKLYVATDSTGYTVTLSSKNDNGQTYYQTVIDTNKCKNQFIFQDVDSLENLQLCITKDNYKPLLVTNLKSQVIVQNQTFTNSSTITGERIIIGSNISSAVEEGPVIINSGTTTFDATNSVTIKNGFECKTGAALEIK